MKDRSMKASQSGEDWSARRKQPSASSYGSTRGSSPQHHPNSSSPRSSPRKKLDTSSRQDLNASKSSMGTSSRRRKDKLSNSSSSGRTSLMKELKEVGSTIGAFSAETFFPKKNKHFTASPHRCLGSKPTKENIEDGLFLKKSSALFADERRRSSRRRESTGGSGSASSRSSSRKKELEDLPNLVSPATQRYVDQQRLGQSMSSLNTTDRRA